MEILGEGGWLWYVQCQLKELEAGWVRDRLDDQTTAVDELKVALEVETRVSIVEQLEVLALTLEEAYATVLALARCLLELAVQGAQ